MTDDDLRHLCNLASIGVSSLRDPDFIRWLTEEAGEREHADFRNIFGIIGDAFAELARRQGMLPTFRVQARRRSEPPPSTTAARVSVGSGSASPPAQEPSCLYPDEAALPDLFGMDGENPMWCDNPGPRPEAQR